MRLRAILAASLLAFALLALLMAVATAVTIENAGLFPFGEAREANRDPAGDIIISDAVAEEVWQVQPSGAYTVYENMGVVVDARSDGNGNIWWTDGAIYFGHLTTADSAWKVWELELDSNLGGLTLDDSGRVWLTHFFGPRIYRVTPGPEATEVCTYTLPGGNSSEYISFHDGLLWMASWGEDRIYSFDPDNRLASWWQLSSTSRSIGLDIAPDGSVWWADQGLGGLGRLKPGLDQMTFYTLPHGTSPKMVDARSLDIWYTEFSSGQPGSVGFVKPLQATGVVSTLVKGSAVIGETCANLDPVEQKTITTRTGTLSWTDQEVTPVVNADGWTVYQLEANATPYGITAGSGYVWIADPMEGLFNQQKLRRLGASREASLGLSVSPAVSQTFHDQAVTFAYTLTYTSSDNSPATSLQIVDDLCNPVVYQSGDANGDSNLDVTEQWRYACTWNPPPHSVGEQSTFTNTATASGLDADGAPLPVVPESSSVNIIHRLGTLQVLKSAPAAAEHGDTVIYEFEASYSSLDGTPAQNVQLDDDTCPPLFLGGDAGNDGLLGPTETWFYLCELTIPAHTEGEEDPVVNIATLSGLNVDGLTLEDATAIHELDIKHDDDGFFAYLPTVLNRK